MFFEMFHHFQDSHEFKQGKPTPGSENDCSKDLFSFGQNLNILIDPQATDSELCLAISNWYLGFLKF